MLARLAIVIVDAFGAHISILAGNVVLINKGVVLALGKLLDAIVNLELCLDSAARVCIVAAVFEITGNRAFSNGLAIDLVGKLDLARISARLAFNRYRMIAYGLIERGNLKVLGDLRCMAAALIDLESKAILSISLVVIDVAEAALRPKAARLGAASLKNELKAAVAHGADGSVLVPSVLGIGILTVAYGLRRNSGIGSLGSGALGVLIVGLS